MKRRRETKPLISFTRLVLTVSALGAAIAAADASAATPKAKAVSNPEKTGPPNAAQPTDSRGPLGLNEYLGQVAEKHAGYKAADITARSAKLYSEESSLRFKPSLFANASATATGQSNPFGDAASFRTKSYSLGVAQATDFGLSGRVSLIRSELAAGSPLSLDYSSTWAQVELTQSLWRNWGGAEINAQVEAQQANALAKSYSQSFLTKQILADAEATYWRLALTREVVKIRKDAVTRAQRITDWAARRSRLQLSDRAEYLQASTALQASKLELRNAEDNERAAAQAFNSSRGINANSVPETLVELSPDLTAKMNVPERTNVRDDVKVAEQQARAGAAAARVQSEANKPNVEVFATVPLNEPSGPPGQLSASLSPGLQPSTTVGVRLTAPLDFATASRVREGYLAEANASNYAYERKAFEEERDWTDLAAKFQQAKDRFKLYYELEKVQRDKLEYERDRQQRGRSTLQQVLLYETDYEQAQMGRVSTLTDLLTLNAQMKLYGVSYESR